MSGGDPVAFGVLISGRGSNLEAILDFWADGGDGHPVASSRPAVVICNRPDAPGIGHGRRHGIPVEVIDHRDFADRASFDQAMLDVLEQHGVQWVVLAGFMRVLSETFLSRYRGRILNTHPSLLPAFPGRDGVGDALAAGVKITGCTVHLVALEVDSGPILAQAAVPVHDGDDVESLGARIRSAEHHLYPRIIADALAGRLILEPGER